MKLTVLVVLLVTLLAMPVRAAAPYQVTEIGLGQGLAINNNGQITGTHFDLTAGKYFATIYDPATGFHDTNFVGGGVAINNYGIAIGYISDTYYDVPVKYNLLGEYYSPIFPYRSHGYLYDINDNNVSVGMCSREWPNACIWDSDNPPFSGEIEQDIRILTDEYSGAYAISNSGVIVGRSRNLVTGGISASSWNTSGLATMLVGETAYDINSYGQIVGILDGQYYLLDPSGEITMIPIREASWSLMPRINSYGQVVGTGLIDGRKIPFYWDPSAGLVDLSPGISGVEIIASGINDSGLITGGYKDSSGFYHMVTWQAVPEPSSLLALVIGLIPLGLAWRHRKP